MRKKFLTTAAFIAFLVLVCGTKSIYACSCGGPKPPCQAAWEADLTIPDLPKDRIVEGTVLASDGKLVSDAKVLYRTDNNIINTVPMVGPGHFRLEVYEGVKIALQAWLEIGNGKYPVSDWLEIPATGDATRIKLVAPSHRIPK
jgi:hypothetical protein